MAFGTWTNFSIDGQLRPPVLNDYDRRWRRVIFESPSAIIFQRTDDSFAHYGASINVSDKTLTLTKGNSRNWNANFTFQRPSQDQLDSRRRNGRPQDPHGDFNRMASTGFNFSTAVSAGYVGPISEGPS